MSPLKSRYPPHTYSRLFRPWDMTQSTGAAPDAVAVQEANRALALRQDVIAEEVNNPSESQNLAVSGEGTPIPTATAKAAIKVELLKVEDVVTDTDQSESNVEELEVDDADDMHTRPTSECTFSQLSDYNKPLNHEQRKVDENVLMTESSKFPNIAVRPTADEVYGIPLPRRHIIPSLHFPNFRDKFMARQQYPLHLLPHSAIPTIPPAPNTMWSAAATLSGSNRLTSALSSTNVVLGSSAAVAASAAATATSFVGMDPYAFGLMEQEYARIMSEEAHLKAINARKQRPKKFKCPHCDVAFSNNGQLRGHIRIHTGKWSKNNTTAFSYCQTNI